MATPSHIVVRLHPAALSGLAAKATAAGLEVADYAQMVLLRDVQEAVGDRVLATALVAENDLKVAAARLAREFSPPGSFDPHVTLKVFKAINENLGLRQNYEMAIGGNELFARRNPQKARVNRAIGSTVKAALRAMSEDTDGKVTKVEVSGELCFSYTLLHPTRT